MKKVIFPLLLTFTLPAVAHDGSLLSTEHLNNFGLFDTGDTFVSSSRERLYFLSLENLLTTSP